MKKRNILLCGVVSLLIIVFTGYTLMNNENNKTYTYEELNSLPANQLYELFVENGLVLSKELQDTFSKEELSTFFKSEFYLLHKGLPPVRSHTMYKELAEETQKVYKKLTE